MGTEKRDHPGVVTRLGLGKAAILPLMKPRPLKIDEHRYGVAIREGSNLWLTLWVRRSPLGEFFVLAPRGERDWNPHVSYHLSGTIHIKSYDRQRLRKKGQPLTGLFKGTEQLWCFSGHATNLAMCHPTLFDGVVEVGPGVLERGMVSVDLIEPGTKPIRPLGDENIVKSTVFTETVLNVVITIYSTIS